MLFTLPLILSVCPAQPNLHHKKTILHACFCLQILNCFENGNSRKMWTYNILFSRSAASWFCFLTNRTEKRTKSNHRDYPESGMQCTDSAWKLLALLLTFGRVSSFLCFAILHCSQCLPFTLDCFQQHYLQRNPSFPFRIISTEGALRLPTTSDNHPILPIPFVQHIALNQLNRPKIDLSRPPMTSNYLQ